MAYSVRIAPRAERDFGRLPREIQRRVLTHLESLATQPRPSGAVKLADQENRYRVRVGDYRIVYSIDDGAQCVLILVIGHRRDVYRLGP